MNKLTPVPLVVPPMIEKALGYDGEARYFATWWEPAGDEARIGDGRTECDANWYAWLAWARDHTYHALLLAPYKLGNSDERADCAIVIDRQERESFVGKLHDVVEFLKAQWPIIQEDIAMQERWAAMTEAERDEFFRRLDAAFREEMSKVSVPSLKDLHAQIEQEARVVDEMLAYLKTHTPKPTEEPFKSLLDQAGDAWQELIKFEANLEKAR